MTNSSIIDRSTFKQMNHVSREAILRKILGKSLSPPKHKITQRNTGLQYETASFRRKVHRIPNISTNTKKQEPILQIYTHHNTSKKETIQTPKTPTKCPSQMKRTLEIRTNGIESENQLASLLPKTTVASKTREIRIGPLTSSKTPMRVKLYIYIYILG